MCPGGETPPPVPDNGKEKRLRRKAGHAVSVDRERLAGLIERERGAYAASFPRSRAAFEAAGGHLLGGVPMTWMRMWPGGFPVYQAAASAARVTGVDGHTFTDFCLGDTGAMAGHSPRRTVKAVQRRFATPVPRVADLQELNTFLLNHCEAERDRVVQSLFGPFTIRDRLAEDLAAGTPLPSHRFDACVLRPAADVDKYQTIAFDNNRYSVPRPFAFRTVTVKGYVDRIAIAAEGRIVATHKRCYEKHKMILEPIHYLATLGRKPGALDHSPAFRDWSLPACFADFRTALEELHGATAGARRFVRVLQLLGEHPLARVRQAVEECRREHLIDADAVIQRTRSLGAIAVMTPDPAASIPTTYAAAGISVPLPDLNRFDRLLSSNPNPDDCLDDVMKIQSYDTSVTGRVNVVCTGPEAT